ncbi:MAG: hypothetical protein JOZ52_14590 [Acidobacteria bacterium]|nr:hypothetical protein [Acidobacteriota bacterium]
MKKIIQGLMLGVMAATLLAVPAFAQEPAASPAATQEDAEAKAALYKQVTDNIKANQQVAYEAAKQYLEKYPNDDPAIINYLKTFVGKYEKFTRQQAFEKALAEKRWADAFPLGKQIVAEKPDDLTTNLRVAWAGLQMAIGNNNANNNEAAAFSQKSLQLIESGKTPDDKPYVEKDKQDQLAWLNYSLYLYNSKNNKNDEALTYLAKSAQYEAPVKNDPGTYLKLAGLYEAKYSKMLDDYNAKYPKDSEETPEKKAALENLKLALDPLIDALARAIAYSGTDPKTQQSRDELKASLTDYYKFRHGSVDGLDAMLANIKTKPLPMPGSNMTATSAAATSDANTANGAKTGAMTPATSATPSQASPAPSPTPQTTAPTKTPTNNTTPASTKTPAATTKPAGKAQAKLSKRPVAARSSRG